MHCLALSPRVPVRRRVRRGRLVPSALRARSARSKRRPRASRRLAAVCPLRVERGRRRADPTGQELLDVIRSGRQISDAPRDAHMVCVSVGGERERRRARAVREGRRRSRRERAWGGERTSGRERQRASVRGTPLCCRVRDKSKVLVHVRNIFVGRTLRLQVAANRTASSVPSEWLAVLGEPSKVRLRVVFRVRIAPIRPWAERWRCQVCREFPREALRGDHVPGAVTSAVVTRKAERVGIRAAPLSGIRECD